MRQISACLLNVHRSFWSRPLPASTSGSHDSSLAWGAWISGEHRWHRGRQQEPKLVARSVVLLREMQGTHQRFVTRYPLRAFPTGSIPENVSQPRLPAFGVARKFVVAEVAVFPEARLARRDNTAARHCAARTVVCAQQRRHTSRNIGEICDP